jgi:uncharacterized damage-inducible protein DinB
MMIAPAVPDRASTSRTVVPAEAAVRVIDELESLLTTIRTDLYVGPRDDGGATVGELIAGCVLRIDTLMAPGVRKAHGSVRFEQLAEDPVAALRKLRVVRTAAARWPRQPLSTVVRVTHAAASPEDAEAAWSTLGTELAFAISEVVAAQRRIRALLTRCGVAVPNGFGATTPPPLRARSSSPPSRALANRLDNIESLVMTLPAGVYTTRVDGRVSGTLGEHVRHCLDHIAALASSQPDTTLSYDRRQRGTAVECDPTAALQEILRLKAAVDGLSTRSLDEPIRVSSLVDASGEAIVATSSLGRELAFVISHTIHHQATMAAVLALQGLEPPAAFGFAPSTLRAH